MSINFFPVQAAAPPERGTDIWYGCIDVLFYMRCNVLTKFIREGYNLYTILNRRKE